MFLKKLLLILSMILNIHTQVQAEDPLGTSTIFGASTSFMGDYKTIHAVGDRAYVGTNLGYFKIFDVSISSAPVLLGTVDINASIEDIDVEGIYV